MKKFLLLISLLVSAFAWGKSEHKPKTEDNQVIKSYECYDEEEEVESSEMIENPDTGRFQKKDYSSDEELKKMEKHIKSK